MMAYLALACRAALAVVFAMAVLGKVAGKDAFTEFVRSVVAMAAVPERLAVPVARATVLAEGLTVLLVVAPTRVTGLIGCILATLLTIVFSVTIVGSLRRGRRVSCRCFGRSNTPIGKRHLVRNTVLLTLTLLGVLAVTVAAGANLAGALVAVLAGSFVGLVIATFEDLAQLVLPAPAA
jgi:hypothetical protein